MRKLSRVAVIAAISAPSLLAGTAWADTTVVQGDSTIVLPTCVEVAASPAVPGSPAVPAATHDITVIDTPAVPAVTHTEIVVDTEAYDETVIDTAAYDETVEAVTHVVHHEAVTHVVHHDAQTIVVHHEAVTHVVHHDAVTHQITVIDVAAIPAVDEVSHLDQKWKKQVKGNVETKVGNFWIVTGTFGYEDWDPNGDGVDDTTGVAHVGAAVITEEGAHNAINGTFGSTRHHTTHYRHVADGAAFKVIDHAAIPGVPAVTHTETVIDTAAYDETVVDAAAYDETVVVVAAYDETVVDAAAYDETVVDAAEHVVHHEAVTHVVHHAADTHTITIVDTAAIPAVTHVQTIIDTPAKPVVPAVKAIKAKTCPTVLPHTGSSGSGLLAIAGFGLAAVAGGSLVLRRRSNA